MEIIIGWKHVIELENVLKPPSKERVYKKDEVEKSNFSLKKKSYIDSFLQKLCVTERVRERISPNNVTKKG